MEDAAFTRAELLEAGDGFPERGPLCWHCKTHIPQFAELSELNEKQVLALIHQGQRVTAMEKLRSLTGCPIRWAKIWVLHEGKPKPTTPCPYCGLPLRSSQAKQCRFCHRDWHNSQSL